MSTRAPQRLEHGNLDTRTGNHVGPDWLGLVPVEVWTLVFQHFAKVSLAGSAPLAEFLDRRLVCKLFDQMIRSEQVAYAAVLAVNGDLLRDARGMPLVKFTDIKQGGWWDVLMDQLRMDRAWLGESVAAKVDAGANGAREAARPGYEILLIDVESSSDTDQLSHYGPPCADICDEDQEGVIGFLAYRTHTPAAPQSTLRSGRRYDNSGPYSYLTVHILHYPSLRPIATHSLLHRGFGSLQDKCDLLTVAPSPKLPEQTWSLSMARNWNTTLGHVDSENKLYSLICTDESSASFVHLRSYAREEGDSPGRTIASIFVGADLVDMKICLVPSQPNLIRIVYIHRISCNLNILNLDRATLAYVSEMTFNRSKIHAFHYSPVHQPDLIALLPMSGCVFICNVDTGAMVTTLYLPRETQASGQKAHGATYRPLLTQLSMTHVAPAQWAVEWVQDVHFAGHENHLWKTNPCGVQIQSDFPAVVWSHVVNSFVVPPVQSRAVLGAHLYVVLSPNGEVSVTDMRRREAEKDARGIWHVGTKFKRRLDLDVTERITGGQGGAFEAVVRRVAPEDVAGIMHEYAGHKVPASGGRDCEGNSAWSWANELSDDEEDDDSDEYRDSDGESEQGSDSSGSDAEQEEEDYAAHYMLRAAHGVVPLGTRGDAVMVQRGPVIAIMRGCRA